MKVMLRELNEKITSFETERKLAGPCLCNLKEVESVENQFTLPLKSVEEIDNLERMLAIPTVLPKLVRNLSHMCVWQVSNA